MAEATTKKRSKKETDVDGNGKKQEHEVKEPRIEEPSMALVPVKQQDLAAWTPRFVEGVDEAVALEEAKVEFMNRVMKEGEHYGKIPGGGKKPVLLKPGAEKLNASMGLHPLLTDAEPPVRDYTGEQHGGQPFWSFRRVCRIYRQTGPGELDRMLIAQAEGSCNSFEIKYRYRDEQRKCPVCGVAAVWQSKGKKDGTSDPKRLGFFCWAKKGGCGANFRYDDQRILTQTTGRVKNMDPFEQENTGLKMADKRALVAATLIATGFSTQFTQDLEDAVPEDSAADLGGYGNEAREGEYVEPQPAPAPRAPTPKASGTTEPSPTVPDAALTPEEQAARLRRQVASKLAGALEPPWTKEQFAEAGKVLGGDVRLLIGTLVELHMTQHDAECDHVKAIPDPVEFMYPHEPAHREWIATLTAASTQTDPDADDIPF